MDHSAARQSLFLKHLVEVSVAEYLAVHMMDDGRIIAARFAGVTAHGQRKELMSVVSGTLSAVTIPSI